jgi:ubiquitin-protein ligase
MERERRVNKEIQDLQLDTSGSGISVKSIPCEKFHFKGHIKGPSDTPYEGGTFVVDIVLPNDYPFRPPKMKFDTIVWHPNIHSPTGYVSLGATSSPKPRTKYPFY